MGIVCCVVVVVVEEEEKRAVKPQFSTWETKFDLLFVGLSLVSVRHLPHLNWQRKIKVQQQLFAVATDAQLLYNNVQCDVHIPHCHTRDFF